MGIGQKLIELRKAKGLTQVQAAELMHMSPTSLRLYELEKRVPRTDTLDKIAKCYGVDFFEFVRVSEYDDLTTEIASAMGRDFYNQASRMLQGAYIHEYMVTDGYNPADGEQAPEPQTFQKAIDILSSIIRNVEPTFRTMLVEAWKYAPSETPDEEFHRQCEADE